MQVSVPMRAQKSKRRMSPRWIGRPFRRNQSSLKLAGHKRYIFSLTLFTLNILVLLVGGFVVGIQDVAARNGYGGYRNYQRYNNERGDNHRNTNRSGYPNRSERTDYKRYDRSGIEKNESRQTSIKQPVVPSPSTPKPPASTASTVTQKTPPNSANEVKSTASAQATTKSDTVTYPSQQISPEARNRLVALAGITAATGLAIFFMSFFGNALQPTRRKIPVRYVSPMGEVLLR